MNPLNSALIACLAVASVFATNWVSAQDAPRWGTLKGSLVFDGPLPEVKSFEEQIRRHPNGKVYLQSEKEHLLDPTWKINAKNRGVANAVITLEPAHSNLQLPIHEGDKRRPNKLVLDTPACAYVPHVLAHYPKWKLGVAEGQTGEQFFVSCSMKNVPGFFFNLDVDVLKNRSYSLMMASGQKTELFLESQKRPITVGEPLRPWMKAYIWVFAHPYFAVTKSDGTFDIGRVPANIELKLIAWHEARGRFEIRTVTFSEGDNTIALKIHNDP